MLIKSPPPVFYSLSVFFSFFFFFRCNRKACYCVSLVSQFTAQSFLAMSGGLPWNLGHTVFLPWGRTVINLVILYLGQNFNLTHSLVHDLISANRSHNHSIVAYSIPVLVAFLQSKWKWKFCKAAHLLLAFNWSSTFFYLIDHQNCHPYREAVKNRWRWTQLSLPLSCCLCECKCFHNLRENVNSLNKWCILSLIG